MQTLNGRADTVYAVAALADGRLATGSRDKTVKLWDLKTERCVWTLDGLTRAVYAVVALANGLLATGSGDGTVKLWDLTTEQCVQTLNGHIDRVSSAAGHTDWVRATAALVDGWLATRSEDNTVKLWEPNRDDVLAR